MNPIVRLCVLGAFATASLITSPITFAAAGAIATVKVSYIAPEKFADFGFAPYEKKANQDALTRVFVQLGEKRLADGQTLSIEVLDVDLAGSTGPWRNGSEVRVVRRSADWSRIHVRYTLQGGGLPTRSGDEWISGMEQSFDPPWRNGSDALASERRMLDQWIVKRLVGNADAR